jgi:hypothetical protein
MLVCDHYTMLSCGRKKTFEEGKHQLVDTTVQAEHGQCIVLNDADNSNCGAKRQKVTNISNLACIFW